MITGRSKRIGGRGLVSSQGSTQSVNQPQIEVSNPDSDLLVISTTGEVRIRTPSHRSSVATVGRGDTSEGNVGNPGSSVMVVDRMDT